MSVSIFGSGLEINMMSIISMLRVATVLATLSSTTLHAKENITEHEQVRNALSPEMLEAIEEIKENQRKLAGARNQTVSEDGARVDVLYIENHPVAVGAINEDGELIVTEF